MPDKCNMKFKEPTACEHCSTVCEKEDMCPREVYALEDHKHEHPKISYRCMECQAQVDQELRELKDEVDPGGDYDSMDDVMEALEDGDLPGWRD